MITEAERQIMARGLWRSGCRQEAKTIALHYCSAIEGMGFDDLSNMEKIIDKIIDAAKDELRREFQANGMTP